MFSYNYAYVCACIEHHFVFKGLMGQACGKCILILQITANGKEGQLNCSNFEWSGFC